MKKSTVAAIAAASLLAFGAVGSAMADVEVSGFADINYDALNSDGPEGTFRASGEIDVIQKGDGATARVDLDLLNAHNSSPGADLTSGTGMLGVDIEQLNVAAPVAGLATITAGIWNSPFGLEGQDATDYNFAANGLLWQAVPSNVAGALLNVAPTDMLSVNLGFINSRADITGALVDKANDFVATVSVTPIEGIGVNLGYLTDNGKHDTDADGTADTKSIYGDQFDVNATVSMVPNLDVTLDYMMGDPATGTNNFDNGYGIHLAYTTMGITAALRYEAATYEGTAVGDTTWTSGSVGYNMAENCVVRLDYTDKAEDKGEHVDTATIQLVHGF